MTKISIPTGTNANIRIPAKPVQQPEAIERIGVSARRAAEMLDISEPSVFVLLKQEKIQAVRFGRRVIVSVQSLRDFVNGTSDCADNNGIAWGCRRKGETMNGNSYNR